MRRWISKCNNDLVCLFSKGNNLSVAADDAYVLYLDGKQVSSGNSTVKQVPLSNLVGVVAIQGNNSNNDTVAGIIASDSVGLLSTNSSWRCNNAYVNGWMNVGFDDSVWPFAYAEARLKGGPLTAYQSSELSGNAYWIWTNNFDDHGYPNDANVYCRTELGKNPL